VQAAALRVFGIETVWRRRGQGPSSSSGVSDSSGSSAHPLLVVMGPWGSAAEAPALVHAMLQSLQLSELVRTEWLASDSARSDGKAPAAVIRFGMLPDSLPPSSLASARLQLALPAPNQLKGAGPRRAAWELLAGLKRELRLVGLSSVTGAV
jgi:hypothetical protein